MNLLINTLEDLQTVVTVSGDLTITGLFPHIRAAQLLLERLTDEPTVALIAEKATDVTDLTPVEAELLTRMRVVVANFALLKYATVSNVLISDMGVHRTNTGEMKDAFEWQLDSVLRQLRADGYEGLETLFRYLDDNVSEISTWSSSPRYAESQSRLIRSAEQFSGYFFIDNSRLVFYALSAAMNHAESRIWQVPVITAPLTVLMGATTPTAEQKHQLGMARQVVVHWTVARALRERSVEINTEGVQVRAISAFTTINVANPADQKTIDSLVLYHENEATRALTQLSKALLPPPANPRNGGPQGKAIVGF